MDQANECGSSQSYLDVGVQTDTILCEDTMVLRERIRVLEQENVAYQSRIDTMVEGLKAKDELLKRNQSTIFNLEEAKRTMENLVEAETNLSRTLRSRYSEVGRIHSTELGRRRKAEETLATVFNILRNPHHL
ncbi:hypothetical protein SCHPADRAFT_219040 [Schizopora paradoxa]|uniref:Uncharacterized protein n=1 Tax=Schizopora paradoxa TaxID=27342 RepID=A0A0H2SH15_9AGAM|nr:hypothetical protein SCHPADRAFT_219040 [Schizopora paradoxa]